MDKCCDNRFILFKVDERERGKEEGGRDGQTGQLQTTCYSNYKWALTKEVGQRRCWRLNGG